jgi:hypothetical protein
MNSAPKTSLVHSTTISNPTCSENNFVEKWFIFWILILKYVFLDIVAIEAQFDNIIAFSFGMHFLKLLI